MCENQHTCGCSNAETRHNWTKEEIMAIYNKPLMELLYEAAPYTVNITTLTRYKSLHFSLLKPEVAPKTVLTVRNRRVTKPK